MPNPAPRPRRTGNLRGTSKTPTKNSLTLLTYTAQTDRCHGIARSYACPFIQRQTKINPAPHDASSGTSQHHKHTTQHCEETPCPMRKISVLPVPSSAKLWQELFGGARFGQVALGAMAQHLVVPLAPPAVQLRLLVVSVATSAWCASFQRPSFGGFGATSPWRASFQRSSTSESAAYLRSGGRDSRCSTV